MQDFIGSLPSTPIALELKDTKLHIKTEQYQSVVNGILADDFPVMPAISGGTKWEVPAADLKKALQQVVFAASNDESRPVLTGVLLHVDDGQLRIAATDSYRLAEKTVGPNKQQVRLLIPATAMQDLLRILGDGTDTVRITHNDQQVLFEVSDVELITRLVDGTYPDYRKLIPTDFANSIVLKRSELINVTRVSSLFARESAGSVTIHLDAASGVLSIHSIASQLGENTSEAKGTVQGTGDITLNSRYLLDGLQALTGEDVFFGFNGKLEPTILKDPKNDDYAHVVMPLKS
jgi:DNA polymerase-3 subunit beta